MMSPWRWNLRSRSPCASTPTDGSWPPPLMLTMRPPDDRAGYQGGPLHTWSRTLRAMPTAMRAVLKARCGGPRSPGIREGLSSVTGTSKRVRSGARTSWSTTLKSSATRLEQVWTLSNQAGWPNAQLLAADTFPTTGSPVRRLREVEVHHVDLGLGYEATDWPAEYVRWELPMALARVPDRLTRPEDAQRLLAWLTGRASSIDGIELRPWM